MSPRLALFGLTLLSLCLSPGSQAQDTNRVNVSAIFGDNMVLQRQMPVPVWGWAPPGSTVVVSFNSQTKSNITDSTGQWRGNLDAMEAGGPFSLAIACNAGLRDSRSVTCGNVMVGEVWLCAGQSNMEQDFSWMDPPDGNQMGAVSNRVAEIASAHYPNIRQFNQYRQPGAAPDKVASGSWLGCTTNNAPSFKAIPYFFARKVHLELGTNIPVGLITAVYGGSPIERWLSREALGTDPELAPNGGSDLYNTFIHPVIPYAIRGILWAQGEANCGNGLLYRKQIKALIQDCRAKWESNLFFYVAQLAYKPGYGGEGWCLVQEAQRLVTDLTNTGVAVTLDVGDAVQIHYPDKQTPGLRLAMWALAKNYGRRCVYSGPLYDRMQVEDKSIRVFFREIGGGLKARGGGALNGFVISGSDGVFVPATAVIDAIHNTVVVSSVLVPSPVAVRYAFTEDPRGCNLYNIANPPGSGNATCPDPVDLPAAAFRTDGPPRSVVLTDGK